MSLSELVNVQITANTVLPTAAGFGTPMVLAYHTHNTDRIRYYSSVAGLTGDSFGVNEPAYKEVSAIFSQNPSVSQVAVGRRALPPLQTVTLTCVSATAGDTYSATFVDSAGVSHTLTYTSTGVPATDASAIETLIAAFSLAGVTPTVVSATITLTATAGHQFDVQGTAGGPPGGIGGSGNPNFTLAVTTADPGVATDLAAIFTVDGTGWYAFSLDSNSKAEIQAAAAWAEANGKIFACNNSDTICATSSTSDVFTALKTSAYTRTYCQFCQTQLLSFAGAAMLGNRLPSDPGSDTWAYKTLAGVPVDTLTQTQINNIEGKNGNYYVNYKGVNVTLMGQSPSGEFMDIVRGVDWLTDRIQTDVFALFVGSSKVPYTDFGVDQIVSIVKADLKAAVAVGFLNGGDGTTPAPTVTAPTVASQSASNRAKRIFPGIQFSAKLAGAIHELTIQGSVTP